MIRIFKHYRFIENIEVLFLLTLGIILQTIDGSPFTVRKRWMTVWETELPSENFSPFVQKCIKTILSTIVVVRCSTTYPYVVSALLVMFSILKDAYSSLLLMWLMIGGLKSILMTLIEALTGVYVCSAFGKIQKACVEFFVSKALELIFAIYLWGSILSRYQEMTRINGDKKNDENWSFLRPRARSLLDASTLQRTARLNNFEFKDVPQIILQMLRREEEMSQDSLLAPGMMLASISNFGSFDDLKTSQSLGELGLFDLQTVKVMGIEDEDLLTPQERALRFLKLTWSDVHRAQETRKPLDKDILIIDDDILKYLMGSHLQLRKPTHTRPEVVLQGIPIFDQEPEIPKKEGTRKRSFELKYGFSLFSFIREKDEMRMREEEQLSGTETFEDGDEERCDEGEDEGGAPFFMSNIREEAAVNRIRLDFVSKKFKGDAYAKLYKEEYMSVIGPEVFDRATKLPKVTAPFTAKVGPRTSVSLPAFFGPGKPSKKKIYFEVKDGGKIEMEPTPIDSPFSSDFSEDLKFINDYQFDKLSGYSGGTDEKHSEIDRKSTHLDSFYSLNEDFGHVEAILLPDSSPAVSKTGSDTIFEEKIFEHADAPKEDEIKLIKEKRPTELGDRMKAREVAISDSPKEIIFSEEVDEMEKQYVDSKKIENLIKPRANRICCRKRKIKIKRIGKRIQKIQLNLIFSKNDRHDGNDQRRDEFKSSPKGSNHEPFCDRDFLSGEGKRIINIKRAVHLDRSRGADEVGEKGSRSSFDGSIGGEICKNKETSCYAKKRAIRLSPKISHRFFIDLLEAHYKSKCKNQSDSWSQRDSTVRLRDSLNFKHKKTKQTKIWKSKVLERAARNNRAIEYETERCYDVDKHCYFSLISDLLARNFLKRYSVIERGKSKEIIMYDEQHSSASVFPDELPKISTWEVNHVSRPQRKLSKSSSFLMSLQSQGTVFEKNSKNEIDESQVASKEYSSRECFTDESSDQLEMTTDLSGDFTGSNEEFAGEETSTTSSDYFSSLGDHGTSCTGEEDPQPCDRESEESFSLYYSKAADLASPLLDMKRFIYPDHIHYSYKHVKKKGFDIDINGGLPLLVRESLTMNDPIGVKNPSRLQDPESEIIRRPMDLSFASSNSWVNDDPNDFEMRSDGNSREEMQFSGDRKYKKSTEVIPAEKSKRFRVESKCKTKSQRKLAGVFKGDDLLVEKLLKILRNFGAKSLRNRNERPPVQISSTQLHSNRRDGKTISFNYNPALVLNENKTKNERRKSETAKERTKDMFARLEREVMFQSKNRLKNFSSFRHG